MRLSSFIFFLVSILSSISSYAQIINGKIVEVTGEGIPYANVALFDNETIVDAMSADSCGYFATSASGLKTPRLRVSMIGYTPVDTMINMATLPVSIVLCRSTMELDEVVVRHRPPTVSMKGDVLVTSVAGSALQHIGTANDVLRHVPLLSVNNNESVEVF